MKLSIRFWSISKTEAGHNVSHNSNCHRPCTQLRL